MSGLLFNRAEFEHPADGCYQIEPKGEHPNAQAGVVEVIDDRAMESQVERFNAAADAGKLSHGREMLIDHEHFKHDPDRESIAYGWLTRLQKRADGVYGQVRWTTVGQAAVDGGEYRFWSTEYDPKDLVVLNREPMRVRPMRLDGLTLTNAPNNRGGKPITNRAGPRQGRSTGAQNAAATAARAARTIAQLADEEQRASGGSLLSSYVRVMNREPRLTALAGGKSMAGRLPVRAPEALEAPADFAAGMLLQLAREIPFPAFSQNLTLIRNRFPGLARMAPWGCGRSGAPAG